MRTLLVIAAAAALVALVLLFGRSAILPDGIPKGIPEGIPIAKLTDGMPHPEVGLIVPLPGWIPLPGSGRVIGAGTYPPQPPWGAAAVVMVVIDGAAADFVAAYGKRLDSAGFSIRRIPNPPNLIIDAPDSSYEADEREGGHVAYVTMRSTREVRVAQLTFWDPPAPRL